MMTFVLPSLPSASLGEEGPQQQRAEGGSSTPAAPLLPHRPPAAAAAAAPISDRRSAASSPNWRTSLQRMEAIDADADRADEQWGLYGAELVARRTIVHIEASERRHIALEKSAAEYERTVLQHIAVFVEESETRQHLLDAEDERFHLICDVRSRQLQTLVHAITAQIDERSVAAGATLRRTKLPPSLVLDAFAVRPRSVSYQADIAWLLECEAVRRAVIAEDEEAFIGNILLSTVQLLERRPAQG